MNVIEDPEFNILKRKFLNFLEKKKSYNAEIREALKKGVNRIVINLNELRDFDSDLVKRLIEKPIKLIPPLESSLLDLATQKMPKAAKSIRSFRVGFKGSLGDNFVVPREMNSLLLTRLVCLEGIVTKLSLLRPKRQETVHYCEQTKKFSSTVYRDATSFDLPPTSSAIPSKDSEGNLLQLEFGYSTYVDTQKIFVQDMPERNAAGEMPRTIEVIAENDLVDSCKAGDRVHITGVYRAIARKATGETSGFYKTVLIANNIRVVSQLARSSAIRPRDLQNIKKISKRKDLLDLFARSVAPNLYGHEYVKKATVLLLLGGEEKILENKTHIRGDINMLLMGDPSVGKSQLLRAVMQIAKLSVSTTGKGSTGVGLTAAVLKDRETGDRYLEAGATVLADRGVICIDEFDKMSEIDRTAIHEVMEQQTVTIAKAGIHTSLNARCSVVAAANPAYSSYDPSKSPQQNIPLPDSILSRFDVLFILLDKLEPENDRRITDHVLKMHRHHKMGMNQQPDLFDRIDDLENEEETDIFERFDPFQHSDFFSERSAPPRERKQRKNDVLAIEFMKKYFQHAKSEMHPVLNKKAIAKICAAYAEIRGRDEELALPITARYVETIIRFATAHAKLRLSSTVEKSDVEAVLQILLFSLGVDAGKPDEEEKENSGAKKKRKATGVLKEVKKVPRNKGKTNERENKGTDKGEDKENTGASAESLASRVMSAISQLSKTAKEEISTVKLMEAMMKDGEVDEKSLRRVLGVLEDRNKIMMVDDVIHRI